MATAPGQDRHPAMPDPVRLVTRSVGLLKRLGMPEQLALTAVHEAASRVRFRMSEQRTGYDWWISQIVNEAERRLEVAGQSSTDRKENTHADRPGS